RGWWESGHTLKCATNEDTEALSYLILRFSMGEWDVPGTGKIKTVPLPNRRRHARFETTDFFPVRDQNGLKHIGGLANLTPMGAMLTSIEPIKEGRILHCRVDLPQRIFQRDYLFFEAECRWCKQNPEKGWYESGYKLTKISEQDAVIIMHLVMHHLEVQTTEEQVDVVG
ncbi:MAG: PilZ domain-containing protein, partial [candidate division Zixibacteria bacterium]|nr:PilZ domain-containing protein [candidate division Zixibacteria bacterium]